MYASSLVISHTTEDNFVLNWSQKELQLVLSLFIGTSSFPFVMILMMMTLVQFEMNSKKGRESLCV